MALNDINQMFSIVDPQTGKPTDYLMRLLRDRGVEVTDIGELVALLQEDVTLLDSIVQQINGTVVAAGTGLDGGGIIGTDDPITFDLEDTTVTPGSYTNTNLTVDQQGRITAASNGSGGGGGNGVDLWENEYSLIIPSANNNTPSVVGCVAGLGGNAFRTLADTNEFTRRKRIGIQSTATINSFGQIRENVATLSFRKGFTVKIRFGREDITAGSRVIAGFQSGWIGTNDPSVGVVDGVFIGKDAGDTNFQIMHNGGGGLCTKIDLGPSFPANTSLTDIYEVTLTAPINATTVNYTVNNIISGATISGVISTNLPSLSVFLICGLWSGTSIATIASLSFFGLSRISATS